MKENTDPSNKPLRLDHKLTAEFTDSIGKTVTFKPLFATDANWSWDHATVWDANFSWKKYYPNPIKRFFAWLLHKLKLKARPDIKIIERAEHEITAKVSEKIDQRIVEAIIRGSME